MKTVKHPWIAAALNFVVLGLGYWYAGKKKKVVSIGFTALSIQVAVHDWNEIVGILTGTLAISEHFFLFIILYPLVFAYDAFQDARN